MSSVQAFRVVASLQESLAALPLFADVNTKQFLEDFGDKLKAET